MIRRKQELIVLKRENVKNGKGIFINELLLNEDEFYHKGRLFAGASSHLETSWEIIRMNRRWRSAIFKRERYGRKQWHHL